MRGGGGHWPGGSARISVSPLAQLGRVLFNQQKVASPQIVQNGAAGHRVGVRRPEKPLGTRLGQNVGHQREEKQREEEEEKHWGKHFEREKRNGIGDF
ncbi:hypothetical protein niasHT_026803 [Heterodera trifolii]|uniref:Uncharacterized protein n=1 Tax=Heterodera trifolii TaxID=157864 RepID=A0ABD2JWD1_9BILA